MKEPEQYIHTYIFPHSHSDGKEEKKEANEAQERTRKSLAVGKNSKTRAIYILLLFFRVFYFLFLLVFVVLLLFFGLVAWHAFLLLLLWVSVSTHRNKNFEIRVVKRKSSQQPAFARRSFEKHKNNNIHIHTHWSNARGEMTYGFKSYTSSLSLSRCSLTCLLLMFRTHNIFHHHLPMLLMLELLLLLMPKRRKNKREELCVWVLFSNFPSASREEVFPSRFVCLWVCWWCWKKERDSTYMKITFHLFFPFFILFFLLLPPFGHTAHRVFHSSLALSLRSTTRSDMLCARVSEKGLRVLMLWHSWEYVSEEYMCSICGGYVVSHKYSCNAHNQAYILIAPMFFFFLLICYAPAAAACWLQLRV